MTNLTVDTVQVTTNADMVVQESKKGEEVLRELIQERLIDRLIDHPELRSLEEDLSLEEQKIISELAEQQMLTE